MAVQSGWRLPNAKIAATKNKNNTDLRAVQEAVALAEVRSRGRPEWPQHTNTAMTDPSPVS
eukprot:4989178-Amphidinium_carterae.3